MNVTCSPGGLEAPTFLYFLGIVNFLLINEGVLSPSVFEKSDVLPHQLVYGAPPESP
jgi:hypothetical protein